MRNWPARGGFPPPGTVIYVQAYLVFRHKGIVSDRWWNGKPMVLTNAPDFGVIEQSWDEFMADLQVFVATDFVAHVPTHQVMQRGRLLLGRAYDLFEYNCDHFVNEAHGRPVVSEQLTVAVGLSAAIGFLAALGART